MTTLIAFDTETTGITRNPFHPGHLIEIAAVRFSRETGDVIAVYHSLCDPDADMVWGGHGITADMLTQAPTFAEVFSQFLAFVDDSLLIAHKAKFDIDVLSRGCERFGVHFPHLAYQCTLEMARDRLPGLPKHRLGDVAMHFAIDSGGWHRALADAHMVRQVFTRMRR